MRQAPAGGGTDPAGARDPYNTRRPVVHELTRGQRLLFWPPALALCGWFRTWRMELTPAAQAALRETAPPRLIVSWHNRSLVVPEVGRRFFAPDRVACLISPSRRAAWEVAFFRLFRLRVVRGSTTRRSILAARELLRELRAGNDAGISPDGPSGPLYAFQPGAVALARLARAPLLMVIPNARAAVRLRTWDRHLVPLPFARIEIAMRVIRLDDPLWRLPDAEAAARLRQVCLELTDDPFSVPDDEQAGTR